VVALYIFQRHFLFLSRSIDCLSSESLSEKYKICQLVGLRHVITVTQVLTTESGLLGSSKGIHSKLTLWLWNRHPPVKTQHWL
jgi:hypothetical protein